MNGKTIKTPSQTQGGGVDVRKSLGTGGVTGER